MTIFVSNKKNPSRFVSASLSRRRTSDGRLFLACVVRANSPASSASSASSLSQTNTRNKQDGTCSFGDAVAKDRETPSSVDSLFSLMGSCNLSTMDDGTETHRGEGTLRSPSGCTHSVIHISSYQSIAALLTRYDVILPTGGKDTSLEFESLPVVVVTVVDEVSHSKPRAKSTSAESIWT